MSVVDPTEPESSTPGRGLPSWLAPLSLVGLLLLLALPAIDRPVHNTMEAMRIACAQSFARGDGWLIPNLWGTPYITKPPLFPWLIVGFSKVLGGVDEVSARLTVTLFSSAALVALWALLRPWVGTATAWLACVILATSYDFAHWVGYAQIDLLLMVAIALALWCLFLGHRRPAQRRIAFAATHLLGSVAFFLKGPVAVPILLAVLLPFLVWRREPGEATDLLLSPGVLFWLAPAAWYGAVFLLSPSQSSGLAVEFTQRITGRLGHEPPLWYLNSLATHFFPWGLLLPLTAVAAWRQDRDVARFATLWGVALFILFSIAVQKMHRYLLPIYPALAVITALGLANRRRWVERSLAAAGGVTALVALIACTGVATASRWLPSDKGGDNRAYLMTILDTHTPLLLFAFATLAAAGIAAAILAWRGRGPVAAAILALALGLVQGPGYWRIQALPHTDVRGPLRQVREIVGADAPLAKYGWEGRDHEAIALYLERFPQEPSGPAELATFAATPGGYVLVPRTAWQEIAGDYPQATEMLRFLYQRPKIALEEILLISLGDGRMPPR
jgi:4-amino-4-deoxy-L-arabinose transferase-like glycosyltransferase